MHSSEPRIEDFCRKRVQAAIQILCDRCVGPRTGPWQRPNDQQCTGTKSRYPMHDLVSKHPGHSVSNYRIPNTSAHDKPDARGLAVPRQPTTHQLIAVRHLRIHQQTSSPGPTPTSRNQREVGRLRDPMLARQHLSQALTRLRPLDLRALTIERPARVRIRSRKPCFFARRRLFG